MSESNHKKEVDELRTEIKQIKKDREIIENELRKIQENGERLYFQLQGNKTEMNRMAEQYGKKDGKLMRILEEKSIRLRKAISVQEEIVHMTAKKRKEVRRYSEEKQDELAKKIRRLESEK